MIKFVRGLACLVLLCLMAACKNDSEDVGMSIRPQADQIILGSDTFHVVSQDFLAEAISAQVDTLLLGDFYSSTYGSTKAEMMVQFAPPLNYKFPTEAYNPQPDSLVLLMYYKNWFGSSSAPLQVSIYEIDKAPLIYSENYMSNFEVSDFTTQSILMGQSVMTSIDKNLADSILEDETYVPRMRYKLSQEQLERFFAFPESAYTSLSAFNNLFKGMYVTTTYGSSTMLHIYQIDLKLYYHYTYDKMGKDTVVNTSIVYPANQEVRQINKFVHDDMASVMVPRDSVNYLTATAGAYPKVNIPIGRMRERITERIGDRLLNYNRALLKVEATELDSSDLAMPIPPSVMLLRMSDYERYLSYNQLPTTADSTAVIGYYSTSNQCCSFDMSYLLTKVMRADMQNFDEELDMILMPVDVTTMTSATGTTLTTVRPRTRLAAATIRSGKNEYSPMRLEVIYNGF